MTTQDAHLHLPKQRFPQFTTVQLVLNVIITGCGRGGAAKQAKFPCAKCAIESGFLTHQDSGQAHLLYLH